MALTKRKKYKCVVFFHYNKFHPVIYQYVNNFKRFEDFLHREHSGWFYANVYDQQGNYLTRIYYNSDSVYKTSHLP